MNYLISGGGTGGHIFPAISIANALKELDPNANILFVGANNRMEMQRVPQAGYRIVGLPIRGFNRANPLKNISVFIDLLRSMRQVKKIIKDFKPDVGIGVGGYASGAAMKQAARMGIPILLQEQNGFAGMTNQLLKNDAAKICVAYEGMERFFPADKLILTGNPVRQNLCNGTKEEAIDYFNQEYGVKFTNDRPTLLIIGGSLGARTINQSILAGIRQLLEAHIQIIWQTGKNYIDECREGMKKIQSDSIVVTDFLSRMDLSYAIADLVVSRAGASSISELCLLGKPSILVPSPNVAENHQYHNAMALVNKNAAILVEDKDADQKLVSTILNTITDKDLCQSLSTHILTLAEKDSALRIAREVLKICSNK